MNERSTWAEVDIEAIERNIAGVKARLGANVGICAVVKADGYGHGAGAVARVALESGASMLAVAIVNEALELRREGFVCPILVMGPAEPQDSARMVEAGLDATVYDLSAARALSVSASERGLLARIHLKVDTGMHRVGCEPARAAELAAAISRLPLVRLAGVFSHFATADSEDTEFAQEQLVRFRTVLSELEALGIDPGIRHMANSAAALMMPESHFDMVRLGIAMYGLVPSVARSWNIPLEPAMSLWTRVSMVKDIAEGETVSYGRRFQAMRPTRIATLPLGYADGWPRALSGRISLPVNGHRAPLVGAVCMDQCMIDVTDAPGLKTGDEIPLFGDTGLSIDGIAGALGTINYEVVCMIGKRVPRVYRRGDR
ncbi:MAG TPA: alanine racemase [bacterium]|nr:alanine racemase [bacterium]